MRPSSEVQVAPPPPSGNPLPPRPPGLHREGLQDRLRPVLTRDPASKANVRSLSCDVPGRESRGEIADAEENEAAAAGRPGGHNILVAVRCRALLMQERQAGGRAVITIRDESVILEDPQITAADDYLRLNKSKQRRYNFDAAFDETASNFEVYARTTRFLISSVIQGFNATVFAYGATSAGKTHTMLGYPGEPGIMLLTLQDLFHEVGNQKGEHHFEIKCSFLEVYNENVRDLLKPDSDFLDIREDPVKGMCVAGISEVGGLESADEIMALLQQANKHRTTEATGANVTSSRSHAVLQVMVHQRDRSADIVSHVNLGKLSMIDLAGSERASHTNNKGMRMIEGANINRSLLALGNCITALSSAVAFVPYRDSKMTRLLKDSLGGNCRTVMIANVSPCHINYEDTHNTLKYANRAKNIKTKAVRNVVRVNYHVSKYNDIIKDLRGEIQELRAKLAEAPEPEPGLLVGSADVPPGIAGDEESEMDTAQSVKWKQELMSNFEERVRIKRRLIDLAHETKNQMVEKSHAQVNISQWESSHKAMPDADEDQTTPPEIRGLQDQMKAIKSELARAEETTRGLERMLLENQEKAEKLQAELPRRVKNKDMRAFLGLISRIYVMEVENMDLQEMVDVTAPLLEQKELEAEALRLQIQLRDRVIEEQDQLLQGEHQATLPMPEGWIRVPAKPTRRAPSNVRWLDEEDPDGSSDPAPRLGGYGGNRGYGRSFSGLSEHPLVGIGGSRPRAASEGPVSPSSQNQTRPPPFPRRIGTDTPPASASGSAPAAEFVEAPRRGRPLDVAGRGLGLPPRPAVVPPDDKEARAARSAAAVDDSWHEGISELDSARLPVVEGQNPLGVHATFSEKRLGGEGSGGEGARSEGARVIRGRASHKKNRRAHTKEEKPAKLHVEASGLRHLEDSQGSGSEHEGTNSPHPGPLAPASTAERRGGIISKLNKRMKSQQEIVSSAKNVY
eukprot:TRINITY_DN76950_c0_g1_i1.p1 TRINITY_DN76950_c0_g1~~TRINITY_DN76950_c0_g1_i1.p1  ORF type:complete len:965 (+),score=229.25 TRINITY_DN76950_c0_g1_i1:204-3098(+)